MRIGLIGCGNIAYQMHAPTLAATPGVEVAGIADVTPARLQVLRDLLGLPAARCHPDARDLLARAEIEAVVVTVPQRFRRDLVMAAITAGKHVLCEKPIAFAPREAAEMIAAARAAGLRLAMVHNYIFFPEILWLKDLILSGRLGEVQLLTQNYLSVEDRPAAAEYRPDWRHHPELSGGGVLMDMLHPIYLAEWLVGSPARSISAAVRPDPSRGGAVEAFALSRLEFDRGYGLINMAWGEGPGGIEVAGTAGRALVFYENFGTCPFMPLDRAYLVTAAGVETPDLKRPHDYAGFFCETYRPLVEDFMASVREGRQPVAPAEAGQRALEIVLGSYESALLERVVRLPLAESDPVFASGLDGLKSLPFDADHPLVRSGLYGLRA